MRVGPAAIVEPGSLHGISRASGTDSDRRDPPAKRRRGSARRRGAVWDPDRSRCPQRRWRRRWRTGLAGGPPDRLRDAGATGTRRVEGRGRQPGHGRVLVGAFHPVERDGQQSRHGLLGDGRRRRHAHRARAAERLSRRRQQHDAGHGFGRVRARVPGTAPGPDGPGPAGRAGQRARRLRDGGRTSRGSSPQHRRRRHRGATLLPGLRHPCSAACWRASPR